MKLIEEMKKEYQEMPEHRKQAMRMKLYSSGVLFFLAFLFFLVYYL